MIPLLGLLKACWSSVQRTNGFRELGYPEQKALDYRAQSSIAVVGRRMFE
jgi:hypothetical protein